MSRIGLFSRGEDKLSQIIAGALGRMKMRAVGAELSPSASILGAPVVQRHAGSRIVIGDDVVLCSRSRWTALGIDHPVVMRTLRMGALLSIGNGTGISGGSFCAALAITIGKRCLIGADVLIADTDFHALAPHLRSGSWDHIACAPVHVGDDVFIGARSVILKGVQIGNGAVIGAGSVVRRSVPALAIVAGNPAVVIRTMSKPAARTNSGIAA